MSLERVETELAVRSTIAAYCQSCDDGRWADFAACFAEEAVVEVMGQSITGRDAIRDWIAAAQPEDKRGKHVTFNTVLDIGDDQVTGGTDYCFLNKQAQVTNAGRYLDTFVREGDRWVFSVRRITFLK